MEAAGAKLDRQEEENANDGGGMPLMMKMNSPIKDEVAKWIEWSRRQMDV